MDYKASCIYVSTRGIMHNCNISPKHSISDDTLFQPSIYSNIQNNQAVYVITDQLVQFLHFIDQNLPLPHLRFNLITGSSVKSPREILGNQAISYLLRKIANGDSPIRSWFAQNHDGAESDFVKRIPLGLDYHSQANGDFWWGPKMTPLDQEELLIKIYHKAPEKRLPKAFCNFQFNMWERHGRDRHLALEVVRKNPHLFELPIAKSDRETTWTQQSHYQFVVSPHGNGLDCHRTYEAIALGCIPIVKRSGISDLFLKLPVLVLDDWDEMPDAIHDHDRIDHLLQSTSTDDLLLSRWIDLIHSSPSQTAYEVNTINPTIPKLIWQHGDSMDDLTDTEKRAIWSWIDRNSDWDFQFCTEEMLIEFAEEFFTEEMKSAFFALPNQAMKAEMWKYAALYEFGGIATDISSVCRQPLNEWLDAEQTGGGNQLHVACENDSALFCHQTIIASPGHPALRIALDLIVERVSNELESHQINLNRASYLTGSELWTSAVQLYLESDEEPMTLFHHRSSFTEKVITIHPCYFFDGVKIKQSSAKT